MEPGPSLTVDRLRTGRGRPAGQTGNCRHHNLFPAELKRRRCNVSASSVQVPYKAHPVHSRSRGPTGMRGLVASYLHVICMLSAVQGQGRSMQAESKQELVLSVFTWDSVKMCSCREGSRVVIPTLGNSRSPPPFAVFVVSLLCFYQSKMSTKIVAKCVGNCLAFS